MFLIWNVSRIAFQNRGISDSFHAIFIYDCYFNNFVIGPRNIKTIMTPRVKHVYKSSNNRRSLTIFEKDSSKDSSAILQSLTSSNVRAQQEQVQKMRSDLQVQERKILQDISNLNYAPPPKPLKIPNVPNILPDDINEQEYFTFPGEFPSFVASPMIFKEASFNYNHHLDDEEDSFLFLDKSVVIEDKTHPTVQSSSPNKVPGSSDLPTSEPGNIYEYEMNDFEEVQNTSINTKSIQSFASPISEKSIMNQSEIEFFTIDPDFLQSFEGIWRKKLDHPIRSADPDSPDHFDLITMISKGARKRNSQQKRK